MHSNVTAVISNPADSSHDVCHVRCCPYTGFAVHVGLPNTNKANWSNKKKIAYNNSEPEHRKKQRFR
jgi:hypothetical protein